MLPFSLSVAALAPQPAQVSGAAAQDQQQQQQQHPADAFAAQALSYASQGAPPQQRGQFLQQALSFAHQTWPEKTAAAHAAMGVPVPPVPKPTFLWTDSGARMWLDTNPETYAQSGSPKGGEGVTAVVLAGWAAAGVPSSALLERNFIRSSDAGSPGSTSLLAAGGAGGALTPPQSGEQGHWIPKEAVAEYIKHGGSIG